MTEETTNQPTWQDKVADLNSRVDKESMWTQVAYISNDRIDCEPVLLSEEHNENFWPIIVEEPPIDLVHPKWDRRTQKWVDTDGTNTNSRLNQVEESVKSLKEQDEQVNKDNTEIKDDLSGIAKRQAVMLKLIGSATSPKAPTTDSKQDGGSTNA